MLGSEITPQLNSTMEKKEEDVNDDIGDLEKETTYDKDDDSDNKSENDSDDDSDEDLDADSDEDLDEDSDEDLDEDSELEVNRGQTINKTNNLKLAQMFKENINNLTLDEKEQSELKKELADLEKNVKTKKVRAN